MGGVRITKKYPPTEWQAFRMRNGRGEKRMARAELHAQRYEHLRAAAVTRPHGRRPDLLRARRLLTATGRGGEFAALCWDRSRLPEAVS